MKFHQLAVGQTFRFEGRLYVKASPMIAWDREAGAQRFLRRSSPVQPAGPEAARAAIPSAPERVREALDNLHQSCAECLEKAAPHLPPPLLATLHEHLEQARRDCLHALELEALPAAPAP